jgi:single-strand DNA-binding protein
MLKTLVIGNLGGDPEMRYTAEGKPTLTFNVASNGRTRKPDGEWQDVTTWVRVRVIGTRAETLSQHLKKGQRVYVDGRLEARPWMDRTNQPQAGLEVFANDVEFMSPRQQEASDYSHPTTTANAPARQQQGQGDDDLEDLPF